MNFLISLVFLIGVIYVFLRIVRAGIRKLGRFGSFGEAEEAREEKSKYQYSRKDFLITRAEHECFDAIVSAVGENYYVFPQLHLSTIINHRVRGQMWYGALAHINRKSVDFVLCDKKYLSPKLAIELDDSTHERADRVERDREVERILKDAGLPLLRLQNHSRLDPVEIGQKIREALEADSVNIKTLQKIPRGSTWW